MLGWSFSVSALTNLEDKYSYKLYARWEGDLWSDQWLMDAIKTGDAIEVVNTGGYPNIYEVKTSIIPNDKFPNKPDNIICIVEVWDQS